MIGKLSYDEISKMTRSLQSSAQGIRTVVNKYSNELSEIFEFCDSLDAYVRFLDSYIEIYRDSDEALQYMIEKNK